MPSTLFTATLAAVLFAGASVRAQESHTVRFVNYCGYGTVGISMCGSGRAC
ncbi:uncharacterized protein FIBRA_07945 [Fibroporia radiculosa]|uniref:CBM1 domain-containing protein n=1 Tax=Fibroporia radiculosa TaxID=599839 RepID=J4GG00_9APHY|nr:uncharacterized protein FIBRA_07945 [Fibroporia radiculosa]CCM05713.1 predicted protein [Fibroporia radiculosa]